MSRKVIGAGVSPVYRMKPQLRWSSLALSICLWMVCAGAVYAGSRYVQEQVSRHGPAVFYRSLQPVLAGVIILIMLAAISSYRTALLWRRYAVLFGDGLVLRRMLRIKKVLWEDVRAVRLRVTRSLPFESFPGSTMRLEITTDGGKRFVLDSRYENAQGLIDRVRKHIFDHRFPEASRRFSAGERIKFGKLAISRTDGLCAGSDCFGWEQLRGVYLHAGKLFLRSEDGAESKPVLVESVANLDILIALLEAKAGLRIEHAP